MELMTLIFSIEDQHTLSIIYPSSILGLGGKGYDNVIDGGTGGMKQLP